jgi:serpin B
MKTKKMFIIILAITVFVILLIYCGYAKQHSPAESNDNKAFAADTNDINAVVVGNTDFAFALYSRLTEDSDAGNLFFSPYSISTALALVYGGARSETQSQMATALHFTLSSQRLCSAFGNLQKQLIQENKSHGYQLLIANALWGQKGEPFLKEFLDSAQNYYGASINQVDFVNETEQSRQKINSWVEEKTKNKIENLIPQGSVDRETALVLTNAIYFKGDWKTKFSKSETQNTDFNVSTNQKVKIPLMHLKDNFKYYADEKLQAIELPYKGNEISMLVLLPNETEGLKEIENTLTAENLNNLLSKITMEKVDVYFPKFKMAWGTFSLTKALVELGMTDAFNPEKADFSGMNGKKDLWISDVFHQSFIEVNEEGTEAAAATGVVMTHALHIESIFRADHPFIFIIKDNRSGSILFMGRVINPTE